MQDDCSPTHQHRNGLLNHPLTALDITDPEEFKAAMPWHTKSPAGKSAAQLRRDGQSLLPFHGRCRCTLVMVGSTIRGAAGQKGFERV